MKNLIRIQGKVVKVESAKTGYYIVIREQETNKQWGTFSQWKPREMTYAFTLRQDGRYFFVVNWQELATNLGQVNNVELDQKKPFISHTKSRISKLNSKRLKNTKQK